MLLVVCRTMSGAPSIALLARLLWTTIGVLFLGMVPECVDVDFLVFDVDA